MKAGRLARTTKRLTNHLAALPIMAAFVLVSTPALCFGQGTRETWQPPEKILDAIGVRSGMRVGEAGAGRGYFTFPLARRVGPEGVVFANDISIASLDVIRERADSEGLANIKIVVGAAEDPLFPERNLDLVVMVYVLHEVEHQVPFLKNLRSYLSPGASLVIIEGNTTGGMGHTPPFMTNRQVSDTLTEAGYELDRTLTFLPRDTIYIYRSLRASGLAAAGIHAAAAAGDLAKVRALLEADPRLLESRDAGGSTPLLSACAAQRVEVASFLLDKGANVNVRDRFRATPLHRASYSYVQGQDLALVQRLIDKGADVNAQGYNGLIPLHQAAQSGGIQLAELLLGNGADINSYDKYSGTIGSASISGTVLQVAINFNPKEEMATFLVEHGATLNRKDSSGNTELHLAALKGYADLTRHLVEHGANVNAVNERGRTALYYAARHGYRRTAEALVAAGAQEGGIGETNYGKAAQLTAPLRDGEAWLWSLGGGGYAVKTMGHLLVFNPDAIDDSPEAGLANGRLNPNELAGQKITGLITIPERWWQYYPVAFGLAKRIPAVSSVVYPQPAAAGAGNRDLPSYRPAAPNESLSVDGVRVHAIPALGGGMGYLVEADGVKILHAGLHVGSNEEPLLARYRKEIDFLKPFGPVDVAILSVSAHTNDIQNAYEPHLYLLDQLSPKVVYLIGANIPEQYVKCAEVLRARGIPITFPEQERTKGERFHFLRAPASAPAAATTSVIEPPRETKP